MSYWEMWPSTTGKEPPLGKLRMLAAVYGCSVSDLLREVGDRAEGDADRDGSALLAEPRSIINERMAALLARVSVAGEVFGLWQIEYDNLVRGLRDWALRMKRRDLLAIIGSAAGAAYAAPLWGALDADRVERIGTALVQPQRMDESTVTHIEAVLYHTMRQEDILGPQAVLEAALAQHSLVRVLLRDCRDGELHGRLLALYSNASRFIGWNLFNLSDFSGAGRYYDLARSAAHEAENDLLSSFTLCNWSHLATWSGDPRLGVEHALGALAWATRADSKLLIAYASDVGARAYASLIRRSAGSSGKGEAAACRSALDSARTNLQSAGADDPMALP
ncbi:MAG TPA: hypothetical protein VNF47_21090 [Streptosporangiaceae bacterium]|nr:hypothetical protein [Streptosporangiaceae bacterium]